VREGEVKMANKDSSSIFDFGFFAGLVIGLAIGFFYAPQSGDKTRAMLRGKAMEIQEKADKLADILT
jgi:gas vesicle protein